MKLKLPLNYITYIFIHNEYGLMSLPKTCKGTKCIKTL